MLGGGGPGADASTHFRRKGVAPQARGDAAGAISHPAQFTFRRKREARRARARDAAGIAQTRGFTLIEMLAVIVLIAIAVTVTAVALHGRGRGQLNAAAQRVAAGLRDTRTHALATRKPQSFSVNLRKHVFAAPGRAPRALPAAATIEVTSAAQAATQPGIARIRFFPDGSSSGGRVTLVEHGRTVTVAVDWLTGEVSVQVAAEQPE